VVALAFGILVPAFALPVLALTAGPLTAGLALTALVTYVAVYTPLKQRSSLALFVGAVPGAIPPLMGWTAVTGQLDAGGLALFALLFAWQLPHFIAISLYLKEDYARGGMKVFALVHGDRTARLWIAATSLLLLPASLLPVALGLASWTYGTVAALASIGFTGYALTGLRLAGESHRWARRIFLATLLYLTTLMVALFVGAHR
jgi:protoheme IX farnesyltransferase